jgi:aspartyl aminopeptidase
MVSADNAHAKHPNHPELSDADNAPTVNGGVVVKFNANQKYTTDSISAAIFTEACRACGVKHQTYYNRADMPGGSTLGSIANTKVSIPTVDVGLPQLAMHSANETAAISDIEAMRDAIRAVYSSVIKRENNKYIID